MNVAEFVKQRIEQIFVDVADQVASGEIEVSEEEAAGVPMLLFVAQTELLGAWQQFLAKRRL